MKLRSQLIISIIIFGIVLLLLPKRAYYEQLGCLRSNNIFRLEKLGLR